MSRVRSSRRTVVLELHASHFHRWRPAEVNPFLRIGWLHIGHSRALADFLLTMHQQ